MGRGGAAATAATEALGIVTVVATGTGCSLRLLQEARVTRSNQREETFIAAEASAARPGKSSATLAGRMSAFNPYAPPTAPSPGGGHYGGAFAQLLGPDLVVSKDAPLPDVCLKCGGPATTRRKQQFVYTPQWVIVIMLLSLLIGAIVALVVQKRGTLQLPLCQEHAQKWKSANLQLGLAFVAMFGAIILGIAIGISANEPAVMVLFLVLGVGALIAVAVINRNVRVMSKKVDDTSITLTKVHPDACRAVVAAFHG